MKTAKNTVKNLSATIKWESQFNTKEGKLKDAKTEIFDVRVFPEGTVPGYVNYKRGETVSIADYETTRVDISVSMPCLKEELIYAMKFVTTFVESELEKALADIEEKYLNNE